MEITLLDEYTDEIRHSLRLILSNETSIHNLKLSPNAKSRRLLHFSGGPDPDLWITLCNASLAEGNKYCYLLRLSFYESEVGNHSYRCNNDSFMWDCYRFPFLWRLDCAEPMQLYQTSSAYEIDRALILEYVIFSSNGTWGLIKPIGQYAILAGVNEFMTKVEKTIPNLSEHIETFLRNIYFESQESPGYIDADVIRRIILPIYGDKETERLLQESGLL